MWKSLVFILECTKEEEKGILKLKEVFEKQGIDVRVYGKERGRSEEHTSELQSP